MDVTSINALSGISPSNSDRSSEPERKGIKTDSTAEQGSVPGKELGRQELEKSIDGLNKFMQSSNTHLSFVLHDKLKEYYVQVIDDQTQEVIREVPSKKMLDVVAAMQSMIGILVDEKR